MRVGVWHNNSFAPCLPDTRRTSRDEKQEAAQMHAKGRMPENVHLTELEVYRIVHNCIIHGDLKKSESVMASINLLNFATRRDH